MSILNDFLPAFTGIERQHRFRAKNRAAGLTGAGRSKMADRPFIGVDGEGGGTDGQGRQHYLLLRAGDDELFRDNSPLSTSECLEFLCNLGRERIAVGFAFGYDSTQILRDLRKDQLDILFLSEQEREIRGLKSKWTWFGEFGIQYLPRQFLKVCRLDKNGACIPGSTRTVWETFGFFQTSFLKACEQFEVISKDQIQEIARNKEARAGFDLMTDEIRRYNRLECELLVKLMETFRQCCYDGNIKPSTWNGAGKIASFLHTQHQTPSKEDVQDLLPADVIEFAKRAYYGGRFEVTHTGRIEGPIYEYDINSAYPAAMLGLPCLEHGRWHRVDCDADDGSGALSGVFVADVAFDHPRDQFLCGFPVRNKAGRLCWPRQGQGTYWSCEIEAARKLGADVTIKAAWRYEHKCQCQTFEWVRKLYEYRKSIGKATKGYPIKLGINSLYGKLAQRIGAGKWQNYLWAGMITAETRAKLMVAASANCGSVLMLATDGIYSRQPLSVIEGSSLGTWEAKCHLSMFIVQPGLYWGPPKPKLRGIRTDSKFFDRYRKTFEDAWTKYCEEWRSEIRPDGWKPPKIPIEIHNFTGLRLANSRGKPETAGMWKDETREINFDWSLKREFGSAELIDNYVWTRPHPGSPSLISLPYDWRDDTVSVAQEFTSLTDAMPDILDFGAPGFQE